ncbi:PEP-CTERM sorting domain-containing protein [Roseiconus nitratireducens]|uniref:PEP-CTERM sorting domain-containing protein n=1 Tax=Roseiconus nitratireducens TaxID=2605748 RepID=A0A5M6DLC2_9BACT|nr:PEP-CTERM sorting domain-containing protein [Roseiconus nitratireducens]KAA5547019.1 PEP-CTERM sorting domain-containing protein [Roseiconus nitratireducens]
MLSKHPLYLLALAAVLTLSAERAQAGIISFDPLVAGNGSPYLGHSEMGFNVTPTVGDWLVAQSFGNPVPSIFENGSDPAEIQIEAVGGGTFTFTAADLASNNGLSQYEFTGFLGAATVFSQTGSVTAGPPFEFFTIPNNVGVGQAIDRLSIRLTPVQTVTSVNIDNINLSSPNSAVPEPSSFAIFGVGACFAFGGSRRRKRPLI